MPYAPVDDIQLYYEEHGSGSPIVFVHGLGSSSKDWFAQVPYFAETHRVITLDLRGHGRSDPGDGPYAIATFARDVAVLLRKLDATPAHVVGLSMGGMVALELAVSAPELVRSLIVVNSVTDVRLRSLSDVWFYLTRRTAVKVLGMHRVGKLIAQRLFVKPEQAHLRQEFVKRWATNDKQAYLRSVDAIMGWSVQDRLSRLTMPTLLVSSESDYTPVSAKNRTVARLPNAKLAVIDDARHAVPVERPDDLNTVVGRFISG